MCIRDRHPGELFPRVGFIVTNLPMEPDSVVRFYNQRGTAEQHIKEGKYAFHWTRLSCRKFRDNEVRLQLHALAYNLATFLRCIELPEAMADWSLTSLQLKLIKIGARVVRHARAITFQLAEVAVTGPMVRAILAAIRRLRAPPSCAWQRSMPKPNESGRTGLPAALKNTTAGTEYGAFAADLPCSSALLARPTTPLGTENACPAVGFRRSSRQTG